MALNEEALLHELAILKAEYDRLLPFSGTAKWFQPGPYGIDNCPRHKAFFKAGSQYPERIFMAANRLGKTNSGGFELACHLTGQYPDWWEGKRFNKPVSAWAAGMTGVTTRDTVQQEMLGPPGRRGEGMIPADCIISTVAKPGIPNGVETVLVRHVSGGVSSLSFRSYDQEVRGFQGTARDVIWLDEEPPQLIYNECLLRTMTTKGIVYVTFTPQWGLTDFVINFYKQADLLEGAEPITAGEAEEREKEKGAKRFKAVVQAGWEHAPWLDEQSKRQMLNDTPPHLRKARSEGKPSIGSGNVYPVTLDEILVDPFEIPAHYKRLYAMDVGWNCTAALFAAIDPDTDTCYLYAEYKAGQKEPVVHASRIKEMAAGWIPGVIDPASRGRSQKDGTQLLQIYRQLGLQVRVADNSVESGVQKGWDRLSSGKVKVFKTLRKFSEEFVIYRRDLHGRIVKENDHLMDCYDQETEVLTKDGWKFWEDVTYQDHLATVNLESDLLEYQQPTELIARDHDGDMVSIKNSSLDFLVTPNHRMVVYARDKKIPSITLAKDLKIWDRLKGTCKWEGSDFEAPFGLTQLQWARFLGWFVSEGHTNSNPKCPGVGYQVGISQCPTSNPEKFAEIRELLSHFPFPWNFSKSGVFYCSNKELWSRLRDLGCCYDKYVPDEIKNARPEVIEAFLESAHKGDGWTNPGGTYTIATTSKRLADDLQELILKTGANSSIRTVKAKPYKIKGRQGTNTVNQYWVYKTKVKNPYLRDSKNKPSFKTVPYKGKVYCATVPNSTLVVRRKNRIIVAGNCFRYLMNSLEKARSQHDTTPFVNNEGDAGGKQYF